MGQSVRVKTLNPLVTEWFTAAGGTSGVTSVNGKTGAVILDHNDISDWSTALNPYAPTANPTFTGVPSAPTAAPGTNTPQIATTAFVSAALAASVAGVSSFNTRTGAVTFQFTDITGVFPAGSSNPFVNGTASPGSANNWSRSDHVHPTDTTRLAVASNLSDVASVTTARSNLGLNTMATQAASAVAITGGSIGGVSVPSGQSLTLAAGSSLIVTGGALQPSGRITLDSAAPVMSQNYAASGTVYWVPYKGNLMPVWNGTQFAMMQCGTLSNVLANSSVGNAGPAATVAATPYDLFIWNNSGTLTLTRGPAWTSSTARSMALSLVNGLYVNGSAITNGPGSGAGTYVGTILTDPTTGTGTNHLPFPAAASNGAQARCGVWNMFNRVPLVAQTTDLNATHTYAAAAWRGWAGSGSFIAQVVRGLQEDAVDTTFTAMVQAAAAAGNNAQVGISFDGAATPQANALYQNPAAATSAVATVTTALANNPGAGMHYYQVFENTNAGTATFWGSTQSPLTLRSTY